MAADVHSLVAAYALDALDEGEEREFEDHLAECERCREELAGLREAAAALAFATPPTTPPPELQQRILEQARSERPNVVPLHRRRRWAATLAAAVANTATGAMNIGQAPIHTAMPSARATRPKYIGLRVNWYGPPITSVRLDGEVGSISVRSRRKSTKLCAPC